MYIEKWDGNKKDEPEIWSRSVVIRCWYTDYGFHLFPWFEKAKPVHGMERQIKDRPSFLTTNWGTNYFSSL